MERLLDVFREGGKLRVNDWRLFCDPWKSCEIRRREERREREREERFLSCNSNLFFCSERFKIGRV